MGELSSNYHWPPNGTAVYISLTVGGCKLCPVKSEVCTDSYSDGYSDWGGRAYIGYLFL